MDFLIVTSVNGRADQDTISDGLVTTQIRLVRLIYPFLEKAIV